MKVEEEKKEDEIKHIMVTRDRQIIIDKDGNRVIKKLTREKEEDNQGEVKITQEGELVGKLVPHDQSVLMLCMKSHGMKPCVKFPALSTFGTNATYAKCDQCLKKFNKSRFY